MRELAALLLGYVDRYSLRVGAARTPIEQQEYARTLGALRGELEGPQLPALMAAGGVMTLNEALDHASAV
jgi:hypothetical protein